MVNLDSKRTACSISLLLIMITASVVIVGGCGMTQQANLWVDPSYHATPMKRIMVIAVRKDQLKRRQWEDVIVTTLNTKEHAGTVAVASYQLFPTDLPDTLAVSQRARGEGFDGVLVVAPATRDTVKNDRPGYTTNEPVTTYSRRWGSYVTRYESVYHYGYTETETSVSVRTDLLVTQEDGKLVWSVTSQSVDPTSVDQFRSSVADRIADQLKKEQFIF
jgi:hypothetical protein